MALFADFHRAHVWVDEWWMAIPGLIWWVYVGSFDWCKLQICWNDYKPQWRKSSLEFQILERMCNSLGEGLLPSIKECVVWIWERMKSSVMLCCLRSWEILLENALTVKLHVTWLCRKLHCKLELQKRQNLKSPTPMILSQVLSSSLSSSKQVSG